MLKANIVSCAYSIKEIKGSRVVTEPNVIFNNLDSPFYSFC